MNIGGVKDYFLSEIKKDESYHKAILSGNIFRYVIIYPNIVQELNPRNSYISFNKKIEKYIWENKIGTPSIGADDTKFKEEKLLLRRPLTGDGKLAAAFSDDSDHYSDVTVYIINKRQLELKYLLPVINSKLASFYCQKVGIIRNQKGQQPQITINQFKKFPIKEILSTEQQPFIEKANTMLSLNQEFHELSQKFQRTLQRRFEINDLPKKLEEWYLLSYTEFIKELGKKKIKLSLSEEAEWEAYFLQEAKKALEIKAKIQATDKEIDQMVYKLYGLTDEEIKIVEE